MPLAKPSEMRVTPVNDPGGVSARQWVGSLDETTIGARALRLAVLGISEPEGGDTGRTLTGDDAPLFKIRSGG